MDISDIKLLILCHNIPQEVESQIRSLFPFRFNPLDKGLEYMVYHLNLNDYKAVD